MIAHNTPKAGDYPSHKHEQLFRHSCDFFMNVAVDKRFLQTLEQRILEMAAFLFRKQLFQHAQLCSSLYSNASFELYVLYTHHFGRGLGLIHRLPSIRKLALFGHTELAFFHNITTH